MSDLDHERVMNLLAEAMELPGPGRGPFLDSTCAGEPDLRRELEELLACAEPASVTFESASQHLVQPDPEHIGPYQILEPIGEGGMATVYKAQQHSPVRRIVALKLIKLGMDTRQFVARFESERQTLALMDHPNIARVYDAGSTQTGRPYFVMEYVPGESLLKYCDEQKLGLRERLELFILVCDAVEHAHRKGIIHRDIKDSNVLITTIDGSRLVPKVIDFGVAKPTSRSLTGHTLQTEHGQLIGTPEYMSPEQAERGELDIDTRTDVYSLGVLLYELIAGVQPIPSELLRSAGYEQVQRIIRETDTPRPSTRLSTLGGADAARIAQRRQVALPTLIRDLRSELEWIPLKAMRKDREQRYRSAAELADDITNYLEHRPLVAGPESGWYRARKFLRRHRFGVVAAATMVILLLGGVIATSWQAIRARRAEVQATEARDNMQVTLEFLTNDVLAGATPDNIPDSKVRDQIVRAMIVPAARRVSEQFKDRPLIEASVRGAIQTVLREIGRADLALPHAEAALSIRRRMLGENHPDTIMALHNYATVIQHLGRNTEAEPLEKDALMRFRRVLGDDDARTLEAMNNYAFVLWETGRFAEAEPLFKEALERYRSTRGGDDPDTIGALNNYAEILQSQRRFREALPLFEEAVERGKRMLGEDNPINLHAMNNYATVLHSLGRGSEAEPFFKQALKSSRRIYGDDHPDTIKFLNNYAWSLNALGRHAEAEPLYRQALDAYRRVLGEDDPNTIAELIDYGNVLLSLGRSSEAEPLLRKAVAQAKANSSLGPTNSLTRTGAAKHARCLDSLNRHDEAIAVRKEFGLPPPTTQKEK